MLDAVSGEDFQAAIVELDGDVDGDFLGGGARDLAETVVQVEAGRGFVKADFGGQPGVLLLFERQRCLPKVRPPVSLCHLRGGGSDAGVEMCAQEGLGGALGVLLPSKANDDNGKNILDYSSAKYYTCSVTGR